MESSLKNGPQVSVIIPTFNRAAIIGQTIENICQQTYPNIEIIIVDDGSTDDTPSVLKSYGGRIRWTFQPNGGPSAARNRGIAMANGEIVAFQDSDDLWHPTKIARQVSLLQKYKESVACLCNSVVELPHTTVVSFKNAPIDPPIEEGLWLNPTEIFTTRFILFNQAVAIRRDVLLRVGGFDESLRLLEDMEMALRLSLAGPWTFIREPLATRQAKLESTLGHEAIHLDIVEHEIRIREEVLQRLDSGPHFDALRDLMKQQLKRGRRCLRATRMKDNKALGPSIIGWAWERLEHYRAAANRRAPWFPQMKIAAVDSERCAFRCATAEGQTRETA